jgi:hypothetical protein
MSKIITAEPEPAKAKAFVDSEGSVEVVMPELKPSESTGEWKILIIGMVLDALLKLAPMLMEIFLDPAVEYVGTWFPAGTTGAVLFAAIRTAYKGWRGHVAGSVLKSELRSRS